MIARESFSKLARALGEDAVVRHEPVEIEGVKPDVTLRPADGAGLALALAALARLGLAAIVRGGGTRLGLGNPPRRGDVILSTEMLTGIDELDAADGVCHVRAGTPLAQVREAAGASGWELPLDPPGASTTAGGAIAAAAVGPRAGVWQPRRAVLGLEVALASGERTRCGGRVVKNVTGYDLIKIYTGSLGTLGVIEGAWLRLRPRPERVLVLEASAPDVETACARALAAARRPTARAAALVDPGDAAAVGLVVELAGDGPSVERDAEALQREAGTNAGPDDAIARVSALQADEAGMRFRLAVPASKLSGALARLRSAGASLLAHPGAGLVYAGFAVGGEDERQSVDAAWGHAAAAARAAGAELRLEAAPAWAKQGRDVFGEPSPAQPLIASLARRFDPTGVLNPGRFAGFV